MENNINLILNNEGPGLSSKLLESLKQNGMEKTREEIEFLHKISQKKEEETVISIFKIIENNEIHGCKII